MQSEQRSWQDFIESFLKNEQRKTERIKSIRKETTEGTEATPEDELIALLGKYKARRKRFDQYVLVAVDADEEFTELLVVPSLDEKSLVLLFDNLKEVVRGADGLTEEDEA